MAAAKTALFSRPISGGVRSIESQDITTGDRYFVDSGKTSTGGDTVGHGDSPDRPFLTWDYAIGQTTENNGDIIYLMPGHAETLSAALDVVLDKDGVKTQGLGWGRSVPTFTITTGAVEAPISWTADDNIVDGIRIVGGNIGGSNETIRIEGTIGNVLSNTTFYSTATKELGIGAGLGVIVLDDSATAVLDLSFINVKHYGGAGNDESFLAVNDGSQGTTFVFFEGCDIYGTFADDAIQADAGTNVNTLWFIDDCRLINAGGNNIVATMDTAAVWYISDTEVYGSHTTTKPLVGVNASYLNNVWSCEPGAAGGTALISTVTNWGA